MFGPAMVIMFCTFTRWY